MWWTKLDKLLFSARAVRLFWLAWALGLLVCAVQLSRNGRYQPLPQSPLFCLDTRTGTLEWARRSGVAAPEAVKTP